VQRESEYTAQQVREFAASVEVGLGSNRKYLPSKYFYDQAGSRLFERICLLPEYYPTRTEAAILTDHSAKVASLLSLCNPVNSNGSGISVVELGSGSSKKTKILLTELLRQFDRVHYFPIDISRNMLTDAAEQLQSEFCRLTATGINADNFVGLEKANNMIAKDRTVPKVKLVLFLGSSIGNFEDPHAVEFLRMLRQKLSAGDYLMVGFDLQKEVEIIEAAYNDSEGVTAKFNLNLLERINTELGGDFVIDNFAHRAFYNNRLHRIEMHLVSLVEQTVYISHINKSFRFEALESIHTENSYKYTLGQIEAMAALAGLTVESHLCDGKKWFSLSLFRVRSTDEFDKSFKNGWALSLPQKARHDDDSSNENSD
jgi:L-histidine Nalpha-methyltransferase